MSKMLFYSPPLTVEAVYVCCPQTSLKVMALSCGIGTFDSLITFTLTMRVCKTVAVLYFTAVRSNHQQ